MGTALLKPYVQVKVQNVEQPATKKHPEDLGALVKTARASVFDTRDIQEMTGSVEEAVGDDGVASLLTVHLSGVPRAIVRGFHSKAFVEVVGGYEDGGNSNIIFFGQLKHVLPSREGAKRRWTLIAEGAHEHLQTLRAVFSSPEITIGDAIRKNMEAVGAHIDLPPSATGAANSGVKRKTVLLTNYTPRFPILDEVASLVRQLSNATGRTYSLVPSYTAQHPLDHELRDHNRNDVLEVSHILDLDLRRMSVKTLGIFPRKVSKQSQSIEEAAFGVTEEEELEFRASLFFDQRVQLGMAVRLTDPDGDSGIVPTLESVAHQFGGKDWGTDIVGRFDPIKDEFVEE